MPIVIDRYQTADIASIALSDLFPTNVIPLEGVCFLIKLKAGICCDPGEVKEHGPEDSDTRLHVENSELLAANRKNLGIRRGSFKKTCPLSNIASK